MNDLSLQAAVVVNSEQAETAFDRVGDKAQQMANEVSTSAGKAGQAVDKIGDGAGASAEKFTRAESRISASIKRATTELELLGKTASQRLEFNIADKGLDASKFEPALKKLREIEAQAMQAQRAATGSLDEMGVSADQTAAALRGVPAQFTDIVTSLQGGQALLTVFLQQGGQLRDMFGGAGNAARALGGYVLGLVNPLTIAAAAAGALAFAYNQGSKEADAYDEALITTGNAAGTNAAQLKAYAQEISGIVGTQGKAAESLAALASTGKVGAESLRDAAKAAVEYERATGQAVGKTAEQFASLRNEPLAAVLKLNDGMNFLTDSTYKQIKSLEEQGKTAEAANVAQRAFADTLSGRAGEMERNLGTVERGWLAVKDAAKSAWDAILNVGRASTSVDQLAEVRKQIAQRENQIANGGFGTNEGGAAFGRPSQAATERLRAELAGLQAKAAALEGVAYATRVSAEEERKRGEALKASAAFDKAGEKFLSDKAKMERELAAARVLGAEAGKSQAAIEERLREIRESYAKKGASNTATENKELRDQMRVLADLAGVSSTYYAELANYQKQREQGFISEKQYVGLVEDLIQKQPFAVAMAKDQAEATRAQAKAAEEASRSYLKYLDSFNKGADSAERQVATLQAEEQASILASQGYYSLAQAVELVSIARLKEQQIGLLGNEEAYLAVQREIEAREKLVGLIGSREARKASEDAAKDAQRDWERAAADIERSLTDSLLRGFESGKDFAMVLRDTIVNMFKTMVLRPVIQGIVQNGMSYIGMGPGGSAGGQGGAMGAINTASSIYSAYGAAGKAGGFVGSLGSAASYGTTIGSQQGAMLAAQEAGMGTLAGGASSLGAALPWIGGALALVSLISSLDDSGTMHTGGAALADSINGVREIEAATIGFGIAAADVSSQIVGSSKQMASSALGLLQGLDGLTGGKNKFSVATGFADDSSKDGAWGSLAISKNGTSLVNWADTQTSRWAPKEFADGEAGAKQYGDAVAAGIKQAIDTLDLPDWAGNIVAKLGDAPSMDSLTAAVQAIMAMPEQMLQAIGTSSQALAGTIYTGMQASDPMGAGQSVADQITYGIEASLYQGFAGQVTGIISTQLVTPVLSAMQAGATLTEAMASASIDTMKAQVAAAGAAFAAIVSDPGFKASLASINTLIAEAVGGAVDGYTAPTAPAAYAPPSPIAPIVASVVSGAGSVSDAVADLAKVFADAKDSLLDTGTTLAVDLLRAQGNATGALGAERANYLAGFADLGQAEQDRLGALYDQNQAIRDQITLLAKQQEAMQAFAASLQSNLSGLYSGGDNRAIDVYAIAAQAVSTAGVGDVGQLFGEMINATTADIKTAALAFVALEGPTVQAKTAVLDAASALISLREAADQALLAAENGLIAAWKTIAQQTIAAENTIIGGLVNAQSALQTALKNSADGMRQFAVDVRKYIGELDATDAGGLNAGQQYAAAQASFAILKAQASAGDTKAQGQLTSAADKLLGLGKETAGTQADYLRMVARVKNELDAVATANEQQAKQVDPVVEKLTALETAQQAVAGWTELAAQAGISQERIAAAQLTTLEQARTEWVKATDMQTAADRIVAELGYSNALVAATMASMRDGTLAQNDAIRAVVDASAAVAAALDTLAVNPSTMQAIASSVISAAEGLPAQLIAGLSPLQKAILGLTDAIGKMSTAGTGTGTATGSATTASVIDKYGYTGYAGAVEAAKAIGNIADPAQQAADLKTVVSQAQALGATSAELATIMRGAGYNITTEDVKAYAQSVGLPSFAGGINRVPYDMTANIHAGEAVVPAQFNPFNPGAQAFMRDPDMLAELKALRTEVTELRKANSTENAAIAGTSLRSAKVLERVAPDGDAIATRTAEAIA